MAERKRYWYFAKRGAEVEWGEMDVKQVGRYYGIIGMAGYELAEQFDLRLRMIGTMQELVDAILSKRGRVL